MVTFIPPTHTHKNKVFPEIFLAEHLNLSGLVKASHWQRPIRSKKKTLVIRGRVAVTDGINYKGSEQLIRVVTDLSHTSAPTLSHTSTAQTTLIPHLTLSRQHCLQHFTLNPITFPGAHKLL